MYLENEMLQLQIYTSVSVSRFKLLSYHEVGAHEVWFTCTIIPLTVFTETQEYRINGDLE